MQRAMKLIKVVVLLFAVGVVFPVKAQCPLSTAVVVDGQADEWGLTWEADEEKSFNYNVCLDDANLYVRVKVEDFYVKRKMGAFGFTLWFDTNGKKKRTYGLKFPVGGTEADERMGQLNKEGEAVKTSGDRVDFQKHADEVMISNLEMLELIGLADDPVTATRSGITNGIKVAIGMDAMGAYVYEAIIPLRSYRLNRANMKGLSVGFETGKLEMPKEKPTTANSPLNQQGITPGQLSRMQGYQGMQGNPKLIYPTTAWTKIELKK